MVERVATTTDSELRRGVRRLPAPAVNACRPTACGFGAITPDELKTLGMLNGLS